MFDTSSGWKIGVETADADGSYIIVPEVQLAVLHHLLAEHCIPHAVEGAVPSRHHADAPSEPVVRLGLAVNAAHVQDILDLTP
jgi:hypothetical protein